MNNTDAANVLLNIAIAGKAVYHPGYDWVVEYAKKSKAHFAGVGIDDYLQQFARRESTELFEQRKTLTKHVQRSLGAMLERPFAKVPRSNWTKIVAFDGDDKGDRGMDFERQVLAAFSPAGLDSFIFERVRYWNIYDPNCFVVVEFQSTDGRTRARPYPFEVTAEMAVDFRYSVHGDLEYLVCRQVEPAGSVDVERLTLYQAMQTVVLQEVSEAERKTISGVPGEKVDTVTGDVVNGQLLHAKNGKIYRIQVPIPHNYPVTPAVRCGFSENPADDGRTRVGIFDAAFPFAEKVVKINSELDLVTALLAFPVSVRYEDQCDAVGCVGGTLADGSTCVVCRGSGWKPRPTSAQEEILLPMPRRPEDAFDLTKVLHYTYPPTDAVKMQVDLMMHYFEQAKGAVFNSQMFTKQETAQTATYHGIELQSVYDTLYPYARQLAKVWAFLAEACKAFTGYQGAMTAAIVFPQNFRFETATDLFAELKMARDAEAGNDTTALIQERIMETLLIDDRERLSRWRVDNAFDPFRGMSDAQILVALSGTTVPEWKKVWWANRGDLMQEIVQEYPDFYRMAQPRQRSIIMEKTNNLISELQAAIPAVNLNL